MENQTPETRQAKLIFKLGKTKDPKTQIDKPVFISKLDGKIVYADIALNLKLAVSYDCEITSTPMGRAYSVIRAEKTPTIKANLRFKKGRKIYNPKTNDYLENMVSTYPPEVGEIVIAPEALNIIPQVWYSVEMVLSPNGRAYIVECVSPAIPAVATIVSWTTPPTVGIMIGEVSQEDLQFDCMLGDERILANKIMHLKNMCIADSEMTVSNYEATCRDLMEKHLSKIK